MKTTLLTLAFILSFTLGFTQTTHVITNSPFPFSNTDITINEGDIIDFQLLSSHNAKEVTQAVYDANQNTPLKTNGFATQDGGEPITFPTAGTYYYVCSNHGSMKGKITVLAAAGINSKKETIGFMEVTPNPVNSVSSINFTLIAQSEVEVSIFNSLGVKRMDLGKKMYSSGEQKVDFDSATLEDGLYTATIIVNGEAALSKKIVVKK